MTNYTNYLLAKIFDIDERVIVRFMRGSLYDTIIVTDQDAADKISASVSDRTYMMGYDSLPLGHQTTSIKVLNDKYVVLIAISI